MKKTTKVSLVVSALFKVQAQFSKLFSLQISVSFQIFVCGMAINVTGGLTDLAQKSEPEVSEKPFSFPKTFYDKSYSKYIPLVYATTGIVIFYLSRKFVNGNVKKMLLDADRKNVTLVTYNLFKKELVQTFPVKDMKFSGSSLKVKNYSSSYYFMSSGTITNETLFRYAVNSKQLLHKN